jgi:hypothetical protein
MTDKFNIFKIKWNRIILDEAHEKLNPVVKMFSTSLKNYILDLDNYLCEKGFKRVITRRQKLLGWGDAFYIRSSVRKSRSFLQYMNCSLLQFEYIVLQSIKIRTLYTYLRNKF